MDEIIAFMLTGGKGMITAYAALLSTVAYPLIPSRFKSLFPCVMTKGSKSTNASFHRSAAIAMKVRVSNGYKQTECSGVLKVCN